MVADGDGNLNWIRTTHTRRLWMEYFQEFTGHLRQIAEEQLRYFQIIASSLTLWCTNGRRTDFQQSTACFTGLLHVAQEFEWSSWWYERSMQTTRLTVCQFVQKHCRQIALQLLNLRGKNENLEYVTFCFSGLRRGDKTYLFDDFVCIVKCAVLHKILFALCDQCERIFEMSLCDESVDFFVGRCQPFGTIVYDGHIWFANCRCWTQCRRIAGHTRTCCTFAQFDIDRFRFDCARWLWCGTFLLFQLIELQGHLEFVDPFAFRWRTDALKYLCTVGRDDIDGIFHAIQIFDIDDGYFGSVILGSVLEHSVKSISMVTFCGCEKGGVRHLLVMLDFADD